MFRHMSYIAQVRNQHHVTKEESQVKNLVVLTQQILKINKQIPLAVTTQAFTARDYVSGIHEHK